MPTFVAAYAVRTVDDDLQRRIEEATAALAAAEGTARRLTVLFDPDAGGPDEIANVLGRLSDLYRSVGGDGLLIAGTGTVAAAPEPVPGP